MQTQPPQQKQKAFPLWVIGVFFAVPMLLCGFGSYFAGEQQLAMKRKSQEDFQREMRAMSPSAPQVEASMPSVDAVALWKGDLLTVRLSFPSERITVTDLSINGVRTDAKLPTTPRFSAQKSGIADFNFSGFHGDGGTDAKLNLAFIIAQPNQKKHTVSLINRLSIPLRNSAKKI